MAHFAVNVAGKPRRMDNRLSPVRTPVLTIPTDRLEDILCAVFFSPAHCGATEEPGK